MCPHRIRSISSEQQIRYTSWPIAGPRRKPRALPRVHTRPEIPIRYPQLSGLSRVHTRPDVPIRVITRPKVPLRHPQLPGLSLNSHSTLGPSSTSATARFLSEYSHLGSFIRICKSGETILLVRGTDPTAKALHEDSRLHAGYSSASGFLHSWSQLRCQIIPCSKYFSTPISVWVVIDSSEYLCISISSIMCYYLSSYEKITTCKSSGYGYPNNPHH